MQDRELTALGVYIFAGGFTLGMRKHFKVVGHLEDGPYGVATVRRNLPDVPVWTDRSAWPVESYKGVDVVYGNPPCAAWSQAGMMPGHAARFAGAAKHLIDERTHCVLREWEVGKALLPAFWVWESVAVAFSKGRDFIDAIAAEANALGYAVTLLLLDGADTGLPQHRERFFFVAHRVGFEPRRPDRRAPTVREVLAAIPADAPQVVSRRLPPTMLEWAGDIKPHEKAYKAWERWLERTGQPTPEKGSYGVKGRPNFLMRRLDPDRVARTIMADNMLHPSEDRYITLLEAQALSGYPLDYEFLTPSGKAGSSSSFRQIQQAVLPPVADWLGGQIARAIREAKPLEAAGVKIVDFRPHAGGTGPRGAAHQGRPRPAGQAQGAGAAAEDRGDVGEGRIESPTALARVMIAEGKDDETIIATTNRYFRPGPDMVKKLQFVRNDLQRLRARLARNGSPEEKARAIGQMEAPLAQS